MAEEGQMADEGGMTEDTPYTCMASSLDARWRGKNRETREGQRDRVPSPSSLPPSPLAGEGRGEGACSPAVIPDVSNTVIPDVSHPIIPDVFNRESTARGEGA